MLARLGDVLYWAGCILAVVPIGFVVCVMIADGGLQSPPQTLFELWPFAALLGISAVPWLIGRACRYVLAGR